MESESNRLLVSLHSPVERSRGPYGTGAAGDPFAESVEVSAEGGGLRLRVVVVPSVLGPTNVSVSEGVGVLARSPWRLRVAAARDSESPRNTAPVEDLPRR